MPHNRLSLLRIAVALGMWICLSLRLAAQPPETAETWMGNSPLDAFAPMPEPWYGMTAELLWLHRTEADGDQSLVLATTALTTSPAIRMDDLNLPTEAGIRGSVFLGPRTSRYVELAYAGIFDQQAKVSVDIDPALTGVIQTSQLFFGSVTTSITNFQYTAIYESELHSAEMNVWSDVEAWRFRPFVGMRWIRQRDNFQLFETVTFGNGGNSEFTNDLLGGQTGFATVLWQRAEWFRVHALCKAGVYRNDMEMAASLNNGGAPLATLNQTFDATSYSGEINITAVWQVAPHLDIHVGYTGLWLTDVGLVGDQNDDFDILAGTGTVDLGGASYQGGHFGVTLAW